MPKILIRPTGSDGEWREAVSRGYAAEDELQELLKDHASALIPIDTTSGDTHTVYAREVASGAGPIDLVGIGSSGSITIVECKLARNDEIKRKVVGQLLDYAAALWQTDLSSFVEEFEVKAGANPFTELERISSSEDRDIQSEVARRLKEGDFRLIIAVDEIDPALRRIIDYVNSRRGGGSGVKLVALAFPRFDDGATEILVTESFGDESRPRVAAAPSGAPRNHLEFWTQFQEYLVGTGAAIRLKRPVATAIAEVSNVIPGTALRPWRLQSGLVGIWVEPRDEAAWARLNAIRDDSSRHGPLLPLGEVFWNPDDQRGLSINWQGPGNDPASWPPLNERMARALETVRQTLLSTD